MAGVSAYVTLGRKLLALAPGGSKRRLQGFAILRADDKLDIYILHLIRYSFYSSEKRIW
jgi:hypothetical protein